MTDIEIPVGKRTARYRFLEMLPGFLTYFFIALPVVLSLLNPLWAAIFIVGYIIMFFIKAIGMAYRTIQGYNFLERARKLDWYERLRELEDPNTSLEAHHKIRSNRSWMLPQHIDNLQRIANEPNSYMKPSETFNAVIIATYNESREVLIPTLEALFASNYDMQQLILILAYEERGPNKKLAEELAERFGRRCSFAAAVGHPSDMPNEVIGKGGNITYAGRYLQTLLENKHIDPDRVLVTTLDSDNRPHPQYLAYAMYAYIIDPNRQHRAYQPIALFLNNIWDVPAPMRVLATGNSFWTIINSMRPHMLRNFASHSQGMASLIQTDFWSTRTIVEDGHQYWRSYFAFDGEYEVTPIYVPVYQDAVLAETYTKTIKAQFLQLRRWAYGASDVAYVGDKGLRSNISFWSFWPRFLRLLESHVSWATAPIIITFGAWAPLIINQEASRSIVAHELPQIASQLQFVAMFGLFITVYLTFKMLPPRPVRYKRRRNIFMLLQWLIMPVVSICYGSAAAVYSQTRLVLGKYLDKFDVTVKAVKK
ncbi:MAG TPA: glycosyltransferase family 2 protein [Candidatus Saccharimonadales bacterium]|nr:glycosyltransferase family 2 protein [Candidatus Saccharimonadales bacterium]